jgi:hypothetical protein
MPRWPGIAKTGRRLIASGDAGRRGVALFASFSDEPQGDAALPALSSPHGRGGGRLDAAIASDHPRGQASVVALQRMQQRLIVVVGHGQLDIIRRLRIGCRLNKATTALSAPRQGRRHCAEHACHRWHFLIGTYPFRRGRVLRPRFQRLPKDVRWRGRSHSIV